MICILHRVKKCNDALSFAGLYSVEDQSGCSSSVAIKVQYLE